MGASQKSPSCADRPVSDVECHARASGRVDRRVGDRDADQVDQRQARDRWRWARSPAVPRLSVEPRMINPKNMNVITTSVRNDAKREYPPRGMSAVAVVWRYARAGSQTS